MRQRGWKYQQWIERKLEAFEHTEIMSGGTQLDIRIHVSDGVTLIFVGVYAGTGLLISEETYATLHDSNESALAWALVMAQWEAGKSASHPG